MDNTAFILDFNLLKEHNLSIDEYLILIYQKNNILYNNSLELLKSLENKQFIKIINSENIVLREKGKLFLELISIENISADNKTRIKKSNRLINSEVNKNIREYRELWKGKKLGSMGSENACKEKLTKWMNENPQYSFEQIMKAAKMYISSVDNLNYLQRADYFISKKDGIVENSTLSAFIDESNDTNDDWTRSLN